MKTKKKPMKMKCFQIFSVQFDNYTTAFITKKCCLDSEFIKVFSENHTYTIMRRGCRLSVKV